MAAFMYRLAGEPPFTPPASSPFEDVTPSTKFYKEILWLASTGVTTGYADGTFRPRDAVNRDAMAAFMYRLAGKPAFTAPRTSPFTDVTPSSKFYKEITWLADEGVSTGWSSDKTYRPYWMIARNAMAAFMHRFDEGVGVGVGQPVDQPADPKPTPEPDPTPEPEPEPTPDPEPTDPGVVTECNDGIDNDGDGWVDWENDLGCYGPGDNSESAQSRDAEAGWTTFDKPTSGDVYYVSSSDGSDSNDGLSPDAAFKTLDKAFERYGRGEFNDYLLFKRGDTFPAENLPWDHYGGKSENERFMLASYGESTERPVIALTGSVNVIGDASYSSVVGLDFHFVDADPASPTFDHDKTSASLQFHSNSESMLFEDVRVRYGQVNLLSEGKDPDEYMNDVEVRRSTFAYSWDAKTWTDRPCISGKAQGMYLARVRNLTIEDSFFHHNGWSEELPGYGCGSQLNHNIYAMGIQDAEITGNTFLHASSIGIKLSAFGPEESWAKEENPPRPIKNVVVENNFFSDSELGISMGGNGTEEYRFIDNTVRGNVFSEMGVDNPTDREFHWSIDLVDNRRTMIEDNYFVNSAPYSNGFGIRFKKESTNDDITVQRNLFYDVAGTQLRFDDPARFGDIEILDNDFVQTAAASTLDGREQRLIRALEGVPSGASFAGNEYSTTHDGGFLVENTSQSLDWWKANHESDASEFTGEFVDPSRNLTSYARSQGYANEGQLENTMLDKSRLNWSGDLDGAAINDHIKEGFTEK